MAAVALDDDGGDGDGDEDVHDTRTQSYAAHDHRSVATYHHPPKAAAGVDGDYDCDDSGDEKFKHTAALIIDILTKNTASRHVIASTAVAFCRVVAGVPTDDRVKLIAKETHLRDQHAEQAQQDCSRSLSCYRWLREQSKEQVAFYRIVARGRSKIAHQTKWRPSSPQVISVGGSQLGALDFRCLLVDGWELIHAHSLPLPHLVRGPRLGHRRH